MKTSTLFSQIIASLLFMTITISSQPIKAQEEILEEAISLINADSIYRHIEWLQNMETRFLMAPNHKNVAENIKARFESYGMTTVRLDSFQCDTYINYSILHYDTTTWQYNVEAKIIGSLNPDQEMIIMGHFDDVQLDSNPEIYAPGADDNASGTAATLEIARVMMQMNYQPEMTIIFLCTAAEELMYYGDAGSEHYAEKAAEEERNIISVINNDMIAYDEESSEIGFSNIIGSETITGIATYITNSYTTLIPDIDSPNNSSGADLQAFIEKGYPGLYLMESIFNPYYHTELDLVENIDLDYLTEVIKISCGSLIYTDITVNTETENKAESNIILFPNPCSELLNIQFLPSGEAPLITIYNASGQLMYHSLYRQDENSLQVDMQPFPAGVYFLKIISPSMNINERILHQ